MLNSVCSSSLWRAATLFLCFYFLSSSCCVFCSGYQPNWPSLDSRPLPKWYDDAKFGIFVHMGVYSVPAWAPVGQYAEWYWWDLKSCFDLCETLKFHLKTYGANYPYEQFAQHLTFELFNATAWAELFYNAGAQYVVPTTKHHEGWTWWKSPEKWMWNAIENGPGFDAVAQLLQATDKYGIHRGVYYSLYEWFNPIYLSNGSQYVNQIMQPELQQVIQNYLPELLWSDGDWDHFSPFWKSTDFLAWLFTYSPVKDTVVVNDRWGLETHGVHGSYFSAEYAPQIWLNHKWEETLGIDVHSFGLNRDTPAQKYRSAQFLIEVLIRSVANNGNFLLDVGVRADGTIDPIMQERLLEIGAWLKMNGEAIYGSRAWRKQQEGGLDNTTLRYTRNPNTGAVYAITLAWPANNQLNIPSPIVSLATVATLLGGDGSQLPYRSGAGGIGLTVLLPENSAAKPFGSVAWVVKLTNVQ